MQVPQNQVPEKSTRKPQKKKHRKKPGKQSGDKHLKGKNLRGERELLQGASMNDVYKVAYDRKIGASDTNEGFWKKGNSGERASSMASSRLDQALGVNMLSNDIEARHGGEWGITSSKVKGTALQNTEYDDVTEAKLAMIANMGEEASYANAKELLALGDGGDMIFDDERERVMQSRSDHRDVDLQNPETQKGFANLQLLDYLTAQRDRHEGNIFVDDETGAVHGIDNDVSFGEDSARDLADTSGPGLEKFEGLPQQVDEDLGYRVLSMTEQEFVRILEGASNDKGKLSQEQIAAALDRLEVLKSHIDDLRVDDKLVSVWNDDTHAAAIESGNGYLARAHNERNREA